MASNSQIAAPLNKSRRSGWLILLIFTAGVILTLLYLNIEKLGEIGIQFDHAPDFGQGFKQFVADGKKLLVRLNPKNIPSKSVATLTPASVPTNDLKSMDRASNELLDQIAKTPNDASLHNRVALIYAGLGDFNAAISHFEKAVSTSHTQLNALLAQEKAQQLKGDNTAVAQTLLEESKVNVELSAAHSSLARVYDQLGQHDKVVAQLDQLNKDISFGSISKTTKAAESEENVANRMSSASLRSLARAQAFMQARRIPEAMQEYKNMIVADPQSAVGHERLGMAALYVNDSYLAAKELEIATKLEPDNSQSHNALGLALQAQGDSTRAQSEFEKALMINPKDFDAAFNLGNLFAALGHYGPAQEAFKRATANNPKAPLAHNHLGTMLSMDGKYRQAIVEFSKALALAPDLASSHYGLGIALYNCKDYPASIREFKRALVLNPALSDAHNKIELAYRKAGSAANFN